MTDSKINPADTSADSSYTVATLSREITSRLEPAFGPGEARAMTRVIWEDLKGYTPTDLVLKSDFPVSEYMLAKIRKVVDDVADKGIPLQYVLGEARFYGMRFEVTPAVLIPRPETAELVDMIVDRDGSRADLRVLDVGTGSGCIAVALARNLPFAAVTGIDCSAAALDIARRNAQALRTRVTFEQADILTLAAPSAPLYDVIVSNPPYVMEKERPTMDAYVADHEPAGALFVPDDDPLRFYHAINRYAWAALADNGELYFELNPLTAEQLAAEMRQAGWLKVALARDSQGQLRFLSAIRPPR